MSEKYVINTTRSFLAFAVDLQIHSLCIKFKMVFFTFGILCAVGTIAIANVLYLLIFRIWLSPISAFPGPLLARTTFWYKMYYQ